MRRLRQCAHSRIEASTNHFKILTNNTVPSVILCMEAALFLTDFKNFYSPYHMEKEFKV